jgi:hypothetical protein
VSTCNQDGSGALPGNAADDCADAGQVCQDGKCTAKVCEPNTDFCASGNIQHCSASGAGFTLAQYCLSETYCQDLSGGGAQCRDKLCVTGATGCLGEDYGTCSSDGVTLAAGFDDCDGAGEVCSLKGCAASAVDDLGGTSDVQSLSTGTVAFDRIHVRTSRKLVEMAAYLSLPSTRTLRWTVYSGGYYDWALIHDQMTTGDGAEVHSSGAMDLTLSADKDYLVGVSVTGGSFASYNSPVVGTQLLSFGSTSGSGSAYFAASLSYYPVETGVVRAMRLTTALP